MNQALAREGMQMGMRACYVCGTAAEVFERSERPNDVECPVCGRYKIEWRLIDVLAALEDRRLLPYLSAHLSQVTDSAAAPTLTTGNWEDLARRHTSTPVRHKVLRLLEYLANNSTVGESIRIENERRLVALLDMRDREELVFLVEHTADSDLVRHEEGPGTRTKSDGQGGWTGPLDLLLRLTVQGWDAVAPVAGGVAGTCFVAMSFHASLDEAYHQGIVPALGDAGFRGGRVDQEPHNDNITDRIRAGIRSAQVIVADFTRQRPGVYYEAGLAEGLGRHVIRTCRADDFENLHFDTRQFFHLIWETPSDLRTKLAEHMRATVGPRA